MTRTPAGNTRESRKLKTARGFHRVGVFAEVATSAAFPLESVDGIASVSPAALHSTSAVALETSVASAAGASPRTDHGSALDDQSPRLCAWRAPKRQQDDATQNESPS